MSQPNRRRCQHSHEEYDRRDEPAQETAVGLLVRRAYERERCAYDSLLQNKYVPYKAPKYYQGAATIRMNGPDGPVVQKARSSVWTTLAAYFLTHRIDPDLFMRAQFSPAALKLDRPPEPNELLSSNRLALYHDTVQSMERTIAVSLTSQRSKATVEIAFAEAAGKTPLDAYMWVLTNDGIELSPLFRYCLARSLTGVQFQDVARHYLPAAVLQYIYFAAAYEQHWGAYLPPGFARVAEQLYARAQADEEQNHE